MRSLKNEKNTGKSILQFIKFGIVGLSNTAISLLIYYIFIYLNPNWYLIGNAVGFFVSVLNAYYWNSKYVFIKEQKGHIKSLIKTFIVYGATFALGTALLFVMVNYLSISPVIAPLLNLILTIPLNFLLNKRWAMK